MKKIIFFGLLSTFISVAWGQSGKLIGQNCDLNVTINKNYSKAKTMDSIMKRYSDSAVVPGIGFAVYNEQEGWWASAQGYADVEKKIPMNNCHLQYLQSVSKTYMAVEILQLKEQGKIDLDAPMTKYLPSKYAKYVKGGERVTVRMLLNHTSGLPDYKTTPKFVSQVVLNPTRDFTPEDELKAIDGVNFDYEPGSKYEYKNVNYLLLSLIGDALTGDHTAWIRKNIFNKLDLKNTYYEGNTRFLDHLYLPESYWDVVNVGRPANVTPMQKMTVACTKGDDGIVCTPVDAVKFLKGLMEGKLLKPESMKEMLDFVKDEKGNKRYGLGLIYFDLGGIPAYGHGGGGLGAGCGLIYVPSKQTYFFFAVNLGVFVDGDMAQKTGKLRDAMVATMLN